VLASLHIENIAVIKCCDIELKEGFTVLTGETGAGKSIIIDSINLLRGAKPERELIRTGESSAMVSALFTDLSDANIAALAEVGVSPDENGELYLQRTMSADGRASTKLNGRSIPVSVQRELSAVLINIHGQHDNQLLLRPEAHIGYLDDYASAGEILNEYSRLFSKMSELKRRIAQLEEGRADNERRSELLKYQLEDIDSAGLKQGEDEKLESDRRRIRAIEKIAKQTRTVYHSLYRSDRGLSAYDLLSDAADALEKLTDSLPEAASLAERIRNCMYEAEDVAETVRSVSDTDYDDPAAALNKIEDRLDIINRLKRKYGASIADILAFRDKTASELDDIELSDEKLLESRREYDKLEKEASVCAGKLHQLRCEAAEKLNSRIMSELRYLDLGEVRFTAQITTTENLGTRGRDDVEFVIATNPGEPMRPLSKIASGGELSRIMLALKSAFADKERTGTLIYDEIDTGVSGKTSQKLGIKLALAGRFCQVLCVTHSAQIAAAADQHLLILKKEVDGRAETAVRELYDEERIDELSRIMGGAEMTEALRSSARELIEQRAVLESEAEQL